MQALPTPTPWREAQATAGALHAALRELGVPGTVAAPLGARLNATDHPVVVIPPLSVADAERLLLALGPYIGSRSRALGHPA
jgi:hypothetical protein